MCIGVKPDVMGVISWKDVVSYIQISELIARCLCDYCTL